MALIKWKAAVSGNWSAAANWSSNTVPTVVDDTIVDLFGNYTVAVTTAEAAKSLDFNAPGASLVESAAGKLALDSLEVDNGYVELNAANVIGSTTVTGGALAVGNAKALGGGNLTLASGEFLALASVTLANPLILGAPGGAPTTVTIAAAAGKRLTLESATGWTVAANVTLDVGAPSANGVVEWHTPSGSSGAPVAVEVRGGVLRAGDGSFSTLLANATTIRSGATIDLAGFSTTIAHLQGNGRVSNSGAAATLTLGAATSFAGNIVGALSLNIGNAAVVLSGASTYSGITTINPGGSLTLGAGGTTGAIGAASGINDNGTLAIARSNTLTLDNAIAGNGVLAQVGTGTTIIKRANTYSGGTLIKQGTLAVGNPFALGSGAVTGGFQGNGKLLGTITETLTNPFKTASGGLSNLQFTVAAARGTTLTLAGSAGWTLDSAVGLVFGAAGQDGTVVWSTPAGSAGHAASIDVKAGTLKAGDANLGTLINKAGSTAVIEAGATLDLAGFSTTLGPLAGSGTVTTSSGAPTLTLSGGDFGSAFGGTFSPVIAGAISVNIGGQVTLTGASTYTGPTTIGAGDLLILGDGGTTGSISASSPIVNNGALIVNRSDTITLGNSVSGGGEVFLTGGGTTNINTANTYSGGTKLLFGTVAIGNAGALGTGGVQIHTRATLLATANITLPNALIRLDGSYGIAATHGKTLTLDVRGADFSLAPDDVVTFGAAGHDGTVVVNQSADASVTGSGGTLEVKGGTLKDGGGLGVFFKSRATTIVDAGATIDFAGAGGKEEEVLNGLTGNGTVTNTGAHVFLVLQGETNFAGTLSGTYSVEFDGPTQLNGLTQYSGFTTITEGPLVNNGTFDLTGDVNIRGLNGTSFINNGLLEKTGGTGTSVVAPGQFVNNGTVLVTSGSIQFTNGITNVGVIEGVLAGNTVTANAAGQTSFFGGTGDNLIEVATAPTYVDGGGGFDTLKLAGNITLAANSVLNVEAIEVADGVSASLANLTGPYSITLLSTAGGHAYVVGSQGNDTITGGAGNDRLNGGQGGDALSGGAGNDVYFIDNAADEVTEAANAGIDRVISTIGYTLGGNVENLTLAGTADINGGGNVLANIIVGNGGDNILIGRGGGDTLSGNGGSDCFRYLAISDSGPGAGAFDHITDFVAGGGTGADKIDLSHIDGITSIQGLITPANPSQTPPATGLHAHSIAWYQVGSDTVVIANASATANHVDMEIVLEGVSAAGLDADNFIPAAAALLVQSAAAFAAASALTQGTATPSLDPSSHQLLAPPQHR